jgi:hypothetical protein
LVPFAALEGIDWEGFSSQRSAEEG